MEIKSNTTETINWELSSCMAEATIESDNSNHVLIKFETEENMSGTERKVFIDNEENLRDIHKALSELIQHIDKKRGVGRDIPANMVVTRPNISAGDPLLQKTFTTSGHHMGAISEEEMANHYANTPHSFAREAKIKKDMSRSSGHDSIT